MAKRCTDLLLASFALVLLAPVTLVVALLVLVTMGRPVLFRQQRPGLHGRLFTIYKFRSMRFPEPGRPALADDDKRLTPLGRLLRATSLDEIPELWNVVVGDMSLVGPRPLLPSYLALYTPEQARRHEVRPGLTGLVQVCGRNELSWDEKFALDLRYVEHRTLRMDAWILLRTVLVVLTRRGISADGYATAPLFEGSAAGRSRVPGRWSP